MYSDNHQKIMIQSNQPTVIEYYSYWGKNKVVHKKFTNEIETTKNTQLIIKSKHRETGKMGPLLEYMPTKGTRTIMNFTYDLSMPYQDGYIVLNTTYLNLNSSYNTFKNNTNILYNNRKEDFEYIKNKSITEPGILFYTENNAQILYIKIYGYAYGNISQVSLISSNKLFLDTSVGILTNFSTIINGKLNTTIQMFLKDMNTNLFGNTIPINTSFSSNFINYTIDKKDHLCNWAITIDPDESGIEDNNIIPFQILQTYIISNKIVTKQDMQTLINKNKTFTRYDLRSAYGTFLTAQSILYFNDEICKYYGAYNNITFKRGDDTQLLVGVNYKSATYTTTYDPTLGIIITNNATKNEIIQFRFMTTVMLPEWERQAVRLSLQNVTSPLYLLYEDMGLNNSDVIFTIDNVTGILTIESTTNQSYYIEVDLKTGIVKVMMKTDEEDELIKGAISLTTEGYCYHGERSDLLVDLLNAFNNFVSDDFKEEFLHDLEDLAGSTLINAGVLTCASGAIPVGAAMIALGIATCFTSTGGNLFSDDALNPYYWADAAPSIISSLLISGSVTTFAKNALILSKIAGTPIGIKNSLKIGFCNSFPENFNEHILSKFKDQCKSNYLKKHLENMNFSKGSYNDS